MTGFVSADYKLKIKTLDQQLAFLPKEVKFCKKCVVSNQRPRIIIDEEGVCSACRFAERKKNKIDWDSREKQLRELCNKYRRTDGRFDVVVPASGGKDSAFVAHMLKYKYGMNPITVTWSPFVYTEIGHQNYSNFCKSGFNNLLYTQNGVFHRKLARISMEALGDAWQPFTYGQMCYAFHIAQAFDIKLVFFGENGEAEYGGDTKQEDLPNMPWDVWAINYFKGPTVDDLVAYGLEETDYFTKGDYSESDLQFYRPPKPEMMVNKGIHFHWFSYYHKWVPQENFYYAVENTGFNPNHTRSEGAYSKYASIDDRMDGFHYWFAYLKFGICRTTSDASHEIRDGHITRDEGIALVKRYDGEFPNLHFKQFLDYLQITEEQFWEVANKYRSPHVWRMSNGEWKIRHTVWGGGVDDMYFK
jgi:N-acetyl sugar amidotransferase